MKAKFFGKQTAALAAAVSASLIFSSAAIGADKKAEKEKEGGISVKLGKTVERSFDDVKKDNYAYGPKQDYDKKTKLTHVYLPYGGNKELYGEVTGKFVDPSPGHVATFHSNDGSTNAILTYKIEFDKAISTFTFSSGRFEYTLDADTAAGIEYSTNGKSWKTIKEAKGTGPGDEQIIGRFADDFKAEKLNSKKLYIRYYTRSVKEPEKHWGSGRWLQIWMAGDPKWGDAATTFFDHHPQIWVK